MLTRILKLLALSFMAMAMVQTADAASARIKKVLPHLIDLKGHNSVSPSLYERDAYQAMLRKNPELCAGLSFDVQWTGSRSKDLVLRVEMRGARENSIQTETLDLPVKKKGLFNTWSSVVLRGEDFKNFGNLIAWRATIWDGDKEIAEQKSFLW